MKTIITAFFIVLVCLNADCNKIDETPVFNGYVLEGTLVNSCNDNTPLKNRTFILRDENDKLNNYSISIKTDSNGFFKINSDLNEKNLIMEDGFGKTILYKIPGGKSINFGNLAYNFTMGLRLIFVDFKNISSNDSLLIEVGGVNPGNPYKRSFIKGQLSSEDLGLIYLKESPMYFNKDSIKGTVFLYKNNLALSNLLCKKNYLVSTNCNTVQELVFD